MLSVHGSLQLQRCLGMDSGADEVILPRPPPHPLSLSLFVFLGRTVSSMCASDMFCLVFVTLKLHSSMKPSALENVLFTEDEVAQCQDKVT